MSELGDTDFKKREKAGEEMCCGDRYGEGVDLKAFQKRLTSWSRRWTDLI